MLLLLVYGLFLVVAALWLLRAAVYLVIGAGYVMVYGTIAAGYVLFAAGWLFWQFCRLGFRALDWAVDGCSADRRPVAPVARQPGRGRSGDSRTPTSGEGDRRCALGVRASQSRPDQG